MRALVLIGCALCLIGCNEFPETHYTTASEATQAGAFERGWVPAVLQPDAADIHEAHDIDSSRGVGQFALNSALIQRLQESCQPATANPANPPYIPDRWGPHADSRRFKTLPVVRCDTFLIATDVKNGLGYFWTPSRRPK